MTGLVLRKAALSWLAHGICKRVSCWIYFPEYRQSQSVIRARLAAVQPHPQRLFDTGIWKE
jgi:hypothetical protein